MIFRNQRGTALLISIMVLALLTLLGMAITSAALVEINITRNETLRDKAFYHAESGWQYALSWLEQQPEVVVENTGSLAAAPTWAQSFCASAAQAPQTLNLGEKDAFAVTITYQGASLPPLYSSDFRRVDYDILARGFAPLNAQSLIQVQVGRMVSGEGY